MKDIISPGSMLGVLGGGQLGAMFAVAARRLGYRVAVWDPDPDASALRVADQPISASFTDSEPLARFAGLVSAVTYEWENVPVAVVTALEQSVLVRPASRTLGLLQNRIAQKTFLVSHNLPVAPFRTVSKTNELMAAAEQIGFPNLCKTATAGYDGKGQWRLAGTKDASDLQEQFRRSSQPTNPWIIEKFLPFQKELSVLVIRGEDGDYRIYPVVENIHEAGILQTTKVPAEIDPGTAQRAANLGKQVVEVLNGMGVFCIEMFLMPDGRLFINEIAPRPHNSGHYTLDACTISQFEQQVRALCNLPLGEVRLLSSAVMVNLIGNDLTKVTMEQDLKNLLHTPGAKLHVYGKRSIRPGRKMGHVTFLAEKAEQAWEAAVRLRQALKR